MHPTRLSAALKLNVLGGRVIGGVRRLMAGREDERFEVESRVKNRLRLAGGAWCGSLVFGARG
jgi:hypothetical protein